MIFHVGNMKIEWIGQRLHLNTHILDAGKRIFMLAVQRNFSKGRRTSIGWSSLKKFFFERNLESSEDDADFG